MAFDLNNTDTLMGWNQLVQIDFTGLEGDISNTGKQVLRVDSYNIGVSQTSDAPDYVAGRQDRTAFKRGPITSQGDLTYPFTIGPNGDAGTGIDMFKVAAELANYPKNAFSIESSVHPRMGGCKINTSELGCTAENEVTANSQVWGIVDDEALATIRSFGDASRIHWGFGAGGISLTGKEVGSNANAGVVEGVDVDGQILLEQIPMFDACSIVGAPEGMLITGFSISIDNQLQRNYTMGTGATGVDQYSPLGLNATSISAGQRRITGTITWQSDFQGYIAQILGSGIASLVIRIAGFELTMNNALWMAEPPTLSTGDRVTCQSSFIALGTGTNAFDALVIGDNTSAPPGL